MLECLFSLEEKGYDLLVHDFRTKEQNHSDNMDRMREGFEEVIQKLDRKLQGVEKEPGPQGTSGILDDLSLKSLNFKALHGMRGMRRRWRPGWPWWLRKRPRIRVAFRDFLGAGRGEEVAGQDPNHDRREGARGCLGP